MLIHKVIVFSIDSGRMFDIRYELLGFDDNSFCVTYTCPFSPGLVSRCLSGDKKDIEHEIDKDGLGYIILPSNFEGKVLRLPFWERDYNDFLKWWHNS